MKHRIKLLVLVLFSFATLPVSSFAAEEPPAVAALLDAMQRIEAGYSRATYASIDDDGNGGAVLNDVSWTLTRPKTKMLIKVGRMVISGVSQRASGAYSFETVMSENAVLTTQLPEAGPLSFSMPSITVKNLHILPEPAADSPDFRAFTGPMIYESSTVPLTTISVAGQTFDAKNFVARWEGDTDTGFGKWDVSLQNVIIPVDAIPNPAFQKDMKEELGFEQFELGFDGSVSMSGKNNKIDFAYGLRLRGKQIGDFEFAIAAQDVPAKLATVMKELQSGAKPNMGKIMPLIIGVKIAKLKLRFVDNNFTKKMLEFAAKKQGTTAEALTSNGAALIQIGLMQFNLPEFSKSVVAAYNAFVADPQNISIEASPESPVALATLMGMIAAPAAAIQTLGVKVEANK